jgi:hypothetical protein
MKLPPLEKQDGNLTLISCLKKNLHAATCNSFCFRRRETTWLAVDVYTYTHSRFTRVGGGKTGLKAGVYNCGTDLTKIKQFFMF